MPTKNVTQVTIKWNLGALSIVATDTQGGAAGAGAQFRPKNSISEADLSALCMEIANAVKVPPGILTLSVDNQNHLVPTLGGQPRKSPAKATRSVPAKADTVSRKPSASKKKKPAAPGRSRKRRSNG